MVDLLLYRALALLFPAASKHLLAFWLQLPIRLRIWLLRILLVCLHVTRAYVLITGTVAFVSAAILLALALAWPLLFGLVFESIRSAVASTAGRLVALGILVALGVYLHEVRKRHRMWYGLAECAVGVAACWGGLLQVTAKTATPLSTSVACAGGVYVLIRGLDNYHTGKKEAAAPVSSRLEQSWEDARWLSSLIVSVRELRMKESASVMNSAKDVRALDEASLSRDDVVTVAAAATSTEPTIRTKNDE